MVISKLHKRKYFIHKILKNQYVSTEEIHSLLIKQNTTSYKFFDAIGFVLLIFVNTSMEQNVSSDALKLSTLFIRPITIKMPY